MRVLKMIVNAFILFVALPVVIVAVLGFVFSPLQTAARATESRIVLEADDIMWNGEAAAAGLEREFEPGSKLGPELDAGLEAGLEPEVLAGLEFIAASDSSSEPALDQGLEAVAALEGDGGAPGDDGKVQNDSPVFGSPSEQPGFPEGVSSSASAARYSSNDLRIQGVIYDGDRRYTWYSQRVLPGGGLDIEGRHVSGEGYVVDGQERIVVASSDLPWGTELEVPFGSGRAVVLDAGCPSGTIDVYTDF